MKPKYCECCGKELEQSPSGYFDEDTGEPTYEYSCCPVKDCKHGYHNFKKKHIFSSSICVNCGEIEYYLWYNPYS
jgi:hypothetical protein